MVTISVVTAAATPRLERVWLFPPPDVNVQVLPDEQGIDRVETPNELRDFTLLRSVDDVAPALQNATSEAIHRAENIVDTYSDVLIALAIRKSFFSPPFSSSLARSLSLSLALDVRQFFSVYFSAQTHLLHQHY